MALTLSFKEGEGFYAGDDLVEIEKIVNLKQACISVNRKNNYLVVDDRTIEILPDVRVGIGLGKIADNFVRLVINAPRNIRISRVRAG